MQEKLKTLLKKAYNISIVFLKKIKEKIHPKSFRFANSWWIIILCIFPVIIFLYYPIGGIVVNNIDKTTYEITPLEDPYQSKTIDTISYIINREVNQKMWTPNLPFFFPAYFLDNMPSFQLGMMKSVSVFGKTLNQNFVENEDMKEIYNLLSYPGTIWMFSPENPLKPVSSANTQYRKARKKLIKFNENIKQEKINFRTTENLLRTLNNAQKSINQSINTLEETIIEKGGSITHLKSDDIFYYHQGKLYGYYLLLNATGQDYKDIIVRYNLYGTWTSLINSLEKASNINPTIIRNGNLDSSITPNHLQSVAFYGAKTNLKIYQIKEKLK